MVTKTGLILVALFIDGLQAAIGWSLWAIATFPGTVGGGAAGAAAGHEVAGEVGAAVGGAIGATFGSILNPLLVGITAPVGAAIGFAISTSISFVLGYGFLCTLLLFFGLKPHKRIVWSGLEILPGLNYIPCWTAFTISCIVAQKKKKGRGILMGVAGLALAPVRGIMRTYKDAGQRFGAPERAASLQRPEEELAEKSEQMAPQKQPRATLQDIRPVALYSKDSFRAERPTLPAANSNNEPYAQAA